MDTLRIGMIGLDTSHCSAFTGNINRPDSPHHVPGGKVVAAYVGGSKAFANSYTRLDKYTQELTGTYGVQLCDTIGDLARSVDAILLESVDGRQHAEQLEQVVAACKPVFVDKPFACSAADARKMVDLAARYEMPLMSASAIRFAAGVAELRTGAAVHTAEAFGPATLLADYPGLFWYGVHSADLLFSFMGRGCRTVQTFRQDEMDLVVGRWSDGRIGTLRGLRQKDAKAFGCTAITADGVKHGIVRNDPPFYALLLTEVMQFFKTGRSPIDIQETVEIIAFLEAANASAAQGGRAITLQ